MQRIDAADPRIEPKSIPTYMTVFYPHIALYYEPPPQYIILLLAHKNHIATHVFFMASYLYYL